MLKNKKEYQSFIYKSLAPALFLHILIFILLYFIYYERKLNLVKNEVSVQFREYIVEQKETDLKIPKRNREEIDYINDLPARNIILENVTSVISIQDTTDLLETLPNSSTILDSFIVNNPSIAALKIAIGQNTKSLGHREETEVEKIQRNFREQLLAYYKFKYPTPLSKFKDIPKGGGMINIPIDDIIDLFK